MKSLVNLFLITHIVTGTIALLVGLIPMFSKKGSRLHNRAGLIYVYCMIAVAASAILLCILQPFKIFRLFLAGIAVFSFYLSFTGWRATKQKKSGPVLGDRLLTYTTLAVSVGMIGFGGWIITQGGEFISILFTFFGILTLVFASQDYRQFGKPVEKNHWFFQHFTRMGGSYISAFTAFTVVNIGRLTPDNTPEWLGLAGWIGPSLIGGMLIGRTVRYYKLKFGATQRTVAGLSRQ